MHPPLALEKGTPSGGSRTILGPVPTDSITAHFPLFYVLSVDEI